MSQLRSQAWFNDPAQPQMTATHLERYLNFGLTLDELGSGRPIIGIAQSGSDLSPCNRHHLELAHRIRDGIIAEGGVPIEFPTHPIQETGRRPGPALDRNLTYLGLVELLHGYPIDGVVLTIGCDKTTPAMLMAAATMDIPAIALSVGPMLNGWHNGKRAGSGTTMWEARSLLAADEIDYDEFLDMVASSTPSAGFCNTMGTATTMNSLAEVMGMQLPGSAAIPAPYRQRAQMAFRTGERIVGMVREGLRPSAIITRDALLNCIVANSALGGSTNAPIHLSAIARHMGVELDLDDWQTYGRDIPLLVNLQPAGEYLAEDFFHAGGVPAVVAQLLEQDLLRGDTLTVTGRTLAQENKNAPSLGSEVIRPFHDPLMDSAGFTILSGNLFDSALMKMSVIDNSFRARYLSDPVDPNAFEAKAIVFDGPEDYEARIDTEVAVDDHSLLVMRGTGPIGYPGAPETVNMRPPAALLRSGTKSLACLGDGRQSGTSGSPSILHVTPEAAAGGNIALLRTGDTIRVDLQQRRVDVLLSAQELEQRRQELNDSGGFPTPVSQTPWQEIYRATTGPLADGMVMEPAVAYQQVGQNHPTPRRSH